MRRLHTLASALSLAICLAALSFWLPSYRRAESVYFNWRATRGTAIGGAIESTSGCVALVFMRVSGLYDDVPMDRWGMLETDQTAVVPRSRWQRIGFIWGHQAMTALGMTISMDAVGVPHWLVAAVFTVLPVQWLRRHSRARRASRRRAAGQCVRCGYNLQANVSGVCPECGMPIPQKGGATT